MMRKIIWLPICLLLFCCQSNPYPTEFSDDALAQKLFDVEGNVTSVGKVLESHKGQKVIIDIWASWCGDCVASMPKIAKFQEKYPNVKWAMISVDDEDEKWLEGIQKFIQPQSISAEQYSFKTGWKKAKDNKFINFIKLDWIPRYMLVDEQGKIAYFYAKTIEDKGIEESL